MGSYHHCNIWCGATLVYAQINNSTRNSIGLTNGYYCSCSSCPPTVANSSEVFSNGIPGYLYGQTNTLMIINPLLSINTGSVGVAILSVSLNYENGHPTGNNATVSIPFSGCGFCNLCGAEDYSLSNGDADCGEGIWGDGMRYFQDPSPAGSIVTQVTIVTTGMFWCEPPSQANFSVNGVSVGNSQVREFSECFCNSCPEAESIPSKVYASGFPGYKYGTLNLFQLGVISGNIGVASIDVVVTFTSNGNEYETIMKQ